MENENTTQNDVNNIASGEPVTSAADGSTTATQAEPVEHPLLTTKFEDYSVTEGLLLLILLALVFGGIIHFIREGL